MEIINDRLIISRTDR